MAKPRSETEASPARIVERPRPWYSGGGWAFYAIDSSGKEHGPYDSEFAASRWFECGCGHHVDDCRPEICSHRFAQDAIWGN